MASHGPSFRFATPRPKEQSSATAASSRLPLRAAPEPDAPAVKTTQLLSGGASMSADQRSPAKLRRKYVPENVKTKLAAQDANVPSRLNIQGQTTSHLPKSAIYPPSSVKLPRSSPSPAPPKVVACLVTPSPPLMSGSSKSAQASPKSNTLRRKPSVIGRFVSARRENVSSQQTPANPKLDTRRDESKFTESPQHERTKLRSPFESSPAHPYQNEPELSHWNPMTTPLSEQSATPSLRYTDSPSVFSHAASATPTSQTSYSPYIAHSPHFGPGAWNSPVKSVQDLRLGLPEDVVSPPQAYQNARNRNFPLSSTQDTTTPVPELAHLMMDAVLPKTNDQQPPPRPSRDDTPSLDKPSASPVIISNLPPRTPSHHRRKSSSSVPEPGSGSKEAGEQVPIPSPTRRASHVQPRPSTSDGKVAHRPKLADPANGVSTARASPAPTTPSKPASRFGFFRRRDKMDLEALREETAKQIHIKKGPTAGTGHEGYGKYAAKGRSGSSVSLSTTNSRPTSTGTGSHASSKRKSNDRSEKGNSASDDFLSQRLSPVYLRGSGASEEGHAASRRIVRSDSSSSVAEDEPGANSSVNSPNLSNNSHSSFEPSRPSRRTYATPASATTSISSRAPSSKGRGSWGSVSRGTDRKASKEHSNELTRDGADRSLPVPSKKESVATQDAEDRSQEDAKAKKSSWSFFSKSSQRQKTTQKWGLFQKSQSSPPKEEHVEEPQPDTEIPNQPRAVAHYAMPENNQHFDFKELEDLMEEADALQLEYQSDRDETTTSASLRPYSQEKSQVYNETAHILASHLKLSPELYGEHVEERSVKDGSTAEQAPVEPSRMANQVSEPRPSRLAQVGRIPKVVSRRDRLRKLPDQSFSRPFAVTQPRPSLGSPELATLQPASSSSLQLNTVLPVQEQAYQLRANQSASTISRVSGQDVDQRTNSGSLSIHGSATEFFSIPMRKNSDLSNSSSSGTPYFPSIASTAIIPSAVSPVSEDEIWQEYDDFIDRVLTPVVSRNDTVKTESPRQDGYFPTLRSRSPPKAEEPLARSKTAFPRLGDMASSLRPDLSPFLGTQRRSQVFSGFEHPAVSPLETGFQNGERVVDSSAQAMDDDSESPNSPQSKPREADYEGVPPTQPKSGMDLNSELRMASIPETIREVDENDAWKLAPKSMANLRFGALMTSKWLSFGRVLFSPGHFQLSDTKPDRVLVIDGLSKDWSYYCALTYPNTTIYSLGPDPAQSTNRQSLSAWQPLVNHRHFSHADMSANFPFPKNFFAVVVFRFPGATSEANLRSALCECKRVLQPGGYLEVSALDLDLTNMGNTARRAVRGLKTQMQTVVPDVCLKPMSDNMQYLLGRRGFENLSRCVVGVPAAGVIADSRHTSHDEREMSFTELVADHSKTGDEAMTKMVAKVGRWWYTRTYEACVLPDGDVSRSIWNDRALLRECEANQTTFKLLICHAQKPAMAKRRTVSL